MTGEVGVQLAQIAGFILLSVLCAFLWRTPHRFRRIPFIAKWLRKVGIDRYKSTNVFFVVHEAKYEQPVKSIVRISAGDCKVQSAPSLRGHFGGRLTLFVEQGVSNVVVELVNATSWQRKLIGRAYLKVDEIHKGGKGKSLVLEYQAAKGQSEPILNISWSTSPATEIEADPEKPMLADVDPIVYGASDLAHGNPNVSPSSKRSHVKAELLLSQLQNSCKGPLKMAGHKYWFQVFKRRNVWCLGWWSDKREAELSEPKGSIMLLRVSSIFADPKNESIFVIRYLKHRRRNSYDSLSLEEVDCSRDSKMDALNNLLQQIRTTKDVKKFMVCSNSGPSGDESQDSTTDRSTTDEF